MSALSGTNLPFEMLANFGFIGALSFILGFAMNHGSICTFIATTELVLKRRPARFLALAECAIWAAIAYVVLEKLPTMHDGWAPLAHMIGAAVLFGVGVYVNGACIFGSVGHFGNGELEFGFTFLGILAILSLDTLFSLRGDPMPFSGTPPLALETLLFALAAFLVLRLGLSLKSETNYLRLTVAMTTIGVTSAALSAFASSFSITTSIGSLLSIPVTSSLIFVCMTMGSFISARSRRHRFSLSWPTWRSLLRKTVGGLLMGFGALLIPGGNDTLLLVGLPMGAWQAFTAYVMMVATLAVLIGRFGSQARPWS
ncbi:YeeE/YedE family protein [Rhizobium sp. 3T7]|uniref:YeeE/YedE thiosulfate transporter family protein n=1 Tax=Rhizobium sp. 3T7 TaxID=2874922 RepID=UPI001CCDD2F7|nr:YeeE/YedE thiosulfate transporter family protein [Rhizobium sp. 3T7]MBZ9793784.1 YeeE/YedE family protein [Rhizobium sp. 3T7]